MRLAHRAPRRPAKRPWKSWRGAEVQQRALNSGSSAPIHSTAHVVGCPATSSCHQASRPGTNGTSARLAARAWSKTSTVGTSWPPAVTFLSASSTMPCAGLLASAATHKPCARRMAARSVRLVRIARGALRRMITKAAALQQMPPPAPAACGCDVSPPADLQPRCHARAAEPGRGPPGAPRAGKVTLPYAHLQRDGLGAALDG